MLESFQSKRNRASVPTYSTVTHYSLTNTYGIYLKKRHISSSWTLFGLTQCTYACHWKYKGFKYKILLLFVFRIS